jgi:hypothetical protein
VTARRLEHLAERCPWQRGDAFRVAGSPIERFHLVGEHNTLDADA